MDHIDQGPVKVSVDKTNREEIGRHDAHTKDNQQQSAERREPLPLHQRFRHTETPLCRRSGSRM
jgi:hypothetical protein